MSARGHAMVTLSAMCYALSVLLVRVATDRGAPLVLTLFTRFAFQCPFFSLQMVVQRVPPVPETAFGRRILVISGGLVTIACMGYVAASAYAPLGHANAVCGTFPIGTILVARLWLNEPFGFSRLPAMLLSASGVAFIYFDAPVASVVSPKSLHFEAFGYAAAAVSAVANSFAYVAVRRAGDAMHPLQNMMVYSFLGLLFTLPMAVHRQVDPFPLHAWSSAMPALAGVCVLGALAQMLLCYGSMTPGVSAGIASLLSSSEMVWAYALQVGILREPTSPTAAAGVALVFAGIMTSLVEHSCCGPVHLMRTKWIDAPPSPTAVMTALEEERLIGVCGP